VLAFLYVGVEASISGWMMTYVHRLLLSGKPWAPISTSLFWIALLCGRAIAPGVLRRVSEAQLLIPCLVIAFVSVASLLVCQDPASIILSAVFAGLTLGPVFPLCLAKALALMRDSPKAKWVFAISGLGGATLPWMTGQFSAVSGSLRGGLVVSVVALGTMIVLSSTQTYRQVPQPDAEKTTA
jgi:fucose permease